MGVSLTRPTAIPWPWLVVLVACAATWNVLGNGFTLDTDVDLTGNRFVTEPGRLGDLLTHDYTAGGGDRSGYYRPFLLLVYWVVWRLGDGGPALFLLLNVVLHAAVSLGAYRLARRFGASPASSAAGAMLFAAHPVHADVTAGVVGLKDLLAAGAVVAVLLLFPAARAAASRGARFGLTAAGLCAFLAGILSKESALAAVPALLLADLYALGDSAGRSALRAGRAAAAAQYAGLGLAVVVKFSLQRAFMGGTVDLVTVDPTNNPLVLLPAASRPLHALGLLPFSLSKLLWPATLSHDYSYNAIPVGATPLSPTVLLGAAIALACLAALLWSFVRRRAFLFAALALAGATYVPTSNLVVLIGTIAAERFLYLPSLWLCLLAGQSLVGSRRPGRARWALLALLVAAGVTRSGLRNADWKDSATLWASAAAAEPRSYKTVVVHADNLRAAAHAAEAAGAEAAAAVARGEALSLLDEALAGRDPSPLTRPLFDDFYRAIFLGQRGTLLADLGRLDEALPLIEAAASRNPGDRLWAIDLARLHVRRGEHQAALRRWDEAMAMGGASARRPAIEEGYLALSDDAWRAGDAASAVEALRHLLRAAPGHLQARANLGNLGILLSESGRAGEAETVFRELLAAEPENPLHHYNLGVTLRKLGRRDEARRAFEEALARTAPDDPLRRDLAAALDSTEPGGP